MIKKKINILISTSLCACLIFSCAGTKALALTTETIQNWNSLESYTGGVTVEYNGKKYEAKWWTQGFIPDTKVQNEWETPWKLVDNTDNKEMKNDTSKIENANQKSSDDKETNLSNIVYPDYSQVDVGKGIEWKDNVFAPFVDSTAWPAFKLSDVSKETKVPYYNLGFIVSKSATICEPTWGTYYSAGEGPLNQEIKKIREMGGDVIVSFGGASNVPLQASAPNAEVLKEQYKRFIKAYKLTRIDFDIEGMWVRDTESLKRNNEALKMLQDELKNEGYNLDIWFTLPVLPSGLDNNGVNVIEMALEDGVIIDGVNVMTMDYGDSAAPNPKDKMGEYGIEAIKNLHSQLKQLYSKANISKSDSELWKMIGTTPMIGMNDVQTEIFDLEDAKQTVSFAKEKGIGMISMWSANRDKANSKGAINYVEITSSSIAQDKFEFSKIFNSYNTGEVIVDKDPGIIDQNGNKQAESSISTWNSSEGYIAGVKVQHNGKIYEAKWWNQASTPGAEVKNDWETPWKLVDPASVKESTNQTTTDTSKTENDNKESNNNQNTNLSNIVYPDYSQVDVGEGIEWENNIFAPFVDSTAWPAFKLSDVSKETKVPYYNLGFIVSKSATICEPTWGTYYSAGEGPLNGEIKKIREMGGDVIVSFGGASNVPLHASAPNAEVLKEQYKRFVKAYKLTRIDFDIEGMWVRDTESLKRNNEALKMLQDELKNEGYNLDVWFTLPVLPSGLDNNGVNVIKMALEAGVIIDGVNVMTMDYGDSAAPSPKDKMGEYGIEAIKNLHSQLKKLYSDVNISRSDSEVWKMIGTTPMIGMNDVQTEIFDLEDAKQTVSFAKEKGIGMISMWSANRDNANSKGVINYVEITSSSIAQEKFEFSKIFNSYNTGELIINNDIIIDADGVNQQTTGAMATWNASESYTAGAKVQYKGKVYAAKWWTQGFAPDTKVKNDWEMPWEFCIDK